MLVRVGLQPFTGGPLLALFGGEFLIRPGAHIRLSWKSAIMTASPQIEAVPAADKPLTELAVSGMTCGNCARHVTEAIQSVREVESAQVRLETGRAKVRWATLETNLPAVFAALARAGYEGRTVGVAKAVDGTPAPAPAWSPLTGWRFNVVVGVIATTPLMIGEWGFGLGMTPWFRWLALVLALPVQVFCGARFYVGAWRQLRRGNSNMDTLVALGSSTAFGYSLVALFGGGHAHLYFMESAAIITLISVGHWLEAQTGDRAESTLKGLLQLAPPQARRLNPDGTETQVAVRELRLKQKFVLGPGDQVPTDGEVVAGESTVEEAMLTGESRPVDKRPGMPVYGGTLNGNGRLEVRVTATGDATALAQVIAAVARAQSSRAEIQRLGDRVSAVFVPVVVVIAVATGLWWGLAPELAQRLSAALAPHWWPAMAAESVLAAAFMHAAAVLVVACPCAMGLATPAAIMAGANAAAWRGILIRDGVALEKAGKLTTVVFDKTGTLTRGHPVVARSEWLGAVGMDTAKLAAALARPSNHPLSQAVAKIAPGEALLTEWREVPGAGVQARVRWNGAAVPGVARLGSGRWLREMGVDLEPGAKWLAESEARGGSVLGLAWDQTLFGLLAVEDEIKPGAVGVVRELQAAGLQVYLLTGDNTATARTVGQAVGIAVDHVTAEVRPVEKAQFIARLREQGQRVAFVGDGINDAPALAAADLGIAVSRASDVAQAAADIILLKSEIEAVPEAIGLARATLRTIKQNLFWAFFYNCVGIPLAALGFMSPILCAAAMGLSDLIVIGNALRLLRWKPRAAAQPPT